jgi:hypothetical protein
MRTRRESQRIREIQVAGHDERRGLARPGGDLIVRRTPQADVTRIDDIVASRNERPRHSTGQ